MGIVTLTVALLPLLGIGGFQLIKAESTGPEKGKVTARITTTAKILWLIYFGLTVIETVALMIAGMDFVDALSHAFATVGTGGFSTKNASIGSFNSAAIDIICTIFMFLSGINFSLFYYLIIKKFSDVYENSDDSIQLEIELIDKNGNTASADDKVIYYQLVGDGGILGIENGKPDDLTCYAEKYRSTYRGRAIVYLKKYAEKIRLYAFTKDGLQAEIEL